MAYYNHNGASTSFWDYGNCSNGGRLSDVGTTFSNAWEHYVYIVDASQSSMKIYKNGVLEVSKTGTSVLSNRNRDLYIGGAYEFSGLPFFFDGIIDDVEIYDRVLNVQEILALTTSTGTLCVDTTSSPLNLTQGLVACYPFSGNADDLSGNNHNGASFGATLINDRFGNSLSAYSFDGVNDYIMLGNYASILPVNNDVSVSVWIKANTFKAQTVLMANPDIYADRFNFMVYYNHNGASTSILDYGNCTGGGRLIDIGTPFNSVWEHYVFITSSSQGFERIYKNGVLQSSKSGASVLTNRNRDLRIGGAYEYTSMPFFFEGFIDDIEIYDRVLNTQEISALYNLQGPLCVTSDIQETATEDFSVSPTITDGVLNIYTKSKENGTLKIYNSIGKLVFNSAINQGESTKTVNLSSLSKGIYFVELRCGKNNHAEKILLQ
ncbi:MAG: LamG-like jellyroll fold domain-containing protein, partial [Bacteroidota bacterium]